MEPIAPLAPPTSAQAHVTTCLNCHTEFEGRFCPTCGQKATTPQVIRLWPFLFFGFQAIQEYDRGIIRTLKELLWRPGRVAKNYVEGHRVKYWHPIKAMFTLTSVVLLTLGLLYKTGLLKSSFTEGFNQGFTQQANKDLNTPEQQKAAEETIKIFQTIFSHWQDWAPAMLFLVVPFMMMGTKLFWRKQPHTWGESLVVNAYYTASTILWLLLLFPLATINQGTFLSMTSIYLIGGFVLQAISYKDFFGNPWPKTVLKTVLCSAFAITLYYIFLIILIIAGIFVWFAFLKERYAVTEMNF